MLMLKKKRFLLYEPIIQHTHETEPLSAVSGVHWLMNKIDKDK